MLTAENNSKNNIYDKQNTVFVTAYKSGNLSDSYTVKKENGVMLLFGKIGEGGRFYPYIKDIGVGERELLIDATKNLREKFPCSLQKLNGNAADFLTDDIAGYADAFWAAPSTAVYYGADVLAKFSEKVGQELYVFQLNDSITLLCAADQFEADVAKEAFEQIGDRLGNEVLVFTKEKRLATLSDWQRPEISRGKTV